MSNIYVTSDLHIGHKNIANFRNVKKGNWLGPEFRDEQDHREWLYHSMRNITKRDILIVLGDCCFTEESVKSFYANVYGTKWLIKGNHDIDTEMLLPYFDRVEGLVSYKGFWLSHAPIHPKELRGKFNCHGHTHYETLEDSRYFNCCVENMLFQFGKPYATLGEIKEKLTRSEGEEG